MGPVFRHREFSKPRPTRSAHVPRGPCHDSHDVAFHPFAARRVLRHGIGSRHRPVGRHGLQPRRLRLDRRPGSRLRHVGGDAGAGLPKPSELGSRQELGGCEDPRNPKPASLDRDILRDAEGEPRQARRGGGAAGDPRPGDPNGEDGRPTATWVHAARPRDRPHPVSDDPHRRRLQALSRSARPALRPSC